ncbi:phosphotransferase family protein [Desertihabitans aurantiacus]|uniref:phosphotransferase family protein n=1 Tax=Desertihabitans aurantiacus TaxID=2282477 RepID=UPI0013002733|nr:aminoglycoside phosphotransferase family protein [Desertihabitans aurantiacus]
MPEESFLAGWHAQVSLPVDAIRVLLADATEDRPAQLEQVVNGYDNEVYRAELSSGSTVFVRVGRQPDELFDGETWAMRQAREAGVPVPQVLLETSVETSTGRRPAMVVASAPGVALAQLLPRLSTTDRAMVLANLGRVLARLHSVRTPGVWRPDHAGSWPDPHELRRDFVARRLAERPHLVAAGLSPTEVERIVALLGDSPDVPPLTGFVLCHGDATPDHLFIDTDLRVSSVIDWGMWHGGSPVGDLGSVASWAHSEPDLDALLAGYGTPLDRSLRERLARSIVNSLVGQVAHHVTIGDVRGTANVTSSLRRALALLG